MSEYLTARDHSLRVPGSSMGLFFPSENRFDGVLSRQLEQLKAQAGRGIAQSDQELVKNVAAVLAELSKNSLNVRSYFPEHGENPVTGFISAYLAGVIQDAAIRRLDDVALEGADHLRDLCRGLIDHQFYLNALTQTERLEQLATISVINLNDVVLQGAVRGLSDCLLHNSFRGYRGSHITKYLLERLTRITKLRLDSPLGLDMNKVSYSIGPFISPTEPSSLAVVSSQLADAIAQLSRSDNWDRLDGLRSAYNELHDQLWRYLADIGIESVKKNSFLMHYLNSSLEQIIRVHVWLLQSIALPRMEPTDMNTAQEQHIRDSFRDKIRENISWEITGVYSRIVPAMFEHKQLGYLDETMETQCLFAFWCIDVAMTNVSIDACKRVFVACLQLLQENAPDPYRSARTSINIAKIGIYALAKEAGDVVEFAVQRYRELRTLFEEKYSEMRFVGDFGSAEGDLMEERSQMVFTTHDNIFFSTVRTEHIRAFFQLVD